MVPFQVPSTKVSVSPRTVPPLPPFRCELGPQTIAIPNGHTGKEQHAKICTTGAFLRHPWAQHTQCQAVHTQGNKVPCRLFVEVGGRPQRPSWSMVRHLVSCFPRSRWTQENPQKRHRTLRRCSSLRTPCTIAHLPGEMWRNPVSGCFEP